MMILSPCDPVTLSPAAIAHLFKAKRETSRTAGTATASSKHSTLVETDIKAAKGLFDNALKAFNDESAQSLHADPLADDLALDAGASAAQFIPAALGKVRCCADGYRVAERPV